MRLTVLPLTLLLGFLGSVASAQTSVATGIYPLGTYDNHGFDTINVANLNAHLVIPVINKPGRGMPLYYNLNYDSAVWSPSSVSGTAGWTLAQAAGWRGDTEIATGYVSFNVSTSHGRILGGLGGPTEICYITTYSGFTYHDPFGVAHRFPILTQNNGCNPDLTVTSGSGTAGDNSGYTMNVNYYDSVSLIGKNGHSFTPPVNTSAGSGVVIDSNGNEITADGSGHFTDTLGMTAITVAGSTSSAETFTYTDTTGTARTVTVNYSTYTVQTNFGCSGIGEYGPLATQLVSSISMPDGSAYTFGYEPTPGYSGNVTGRLASIQLPAGGTISYAYSGINCADGGPTGLTRTLANDTTGSTTWTYTRTPGTGTSHTSVMDGLSNDLEYDFVYGSGGNNLYETQRAVYNGSGGGTPVLDQVTCYNGVTTSCVTAALTPPISETDTYATHDGLVQNGTTTTYDTYGDMLNQTIYDYGTSTSRGPVLTSETLSGYGTAAIINEPSSDVITDAAGHTLSEIVYGYDGSTPTATSGLPQHIVTGYPGGNLTSVYNLYGTTTYTYDDAGQPRSATDPNGNTTTYTYDSSYDAYLTGISYPTVGSATQTTSITPDFNTGLPLSVSADGRPSTTYTYNAMLQPLTATYPDGGETSWTYSPSGNVSTSTSAYITATILHASGSSYTQTTTLDWYARTKEVASPAASGTSLVDYGFDANGNQAKTSNPYASGGSPLWNTLSYDVLGRATALKEPDCGSSCSTQTLAFSGNSMLFTDEAGKQREIFTDGLGRTSEVLEPNSSGTLNLETDYLYDQNYSTSTDTYQTVVNQKGGSSSSSDWRQRTFTYDLAGRLKNETTPEAGLTTYTYFSSGTTLCSGNLSAVCTRTDARGAKATYSYDADNRLTGISYTTSGTGAASTPSVSYYYDQSSYNGLSISNGLGNRTGMSDGSGSTAWSFDSMGRILATRKTLNSHTLQANYTYYLDGTINTLQDFSGDTLTYSYNTAGQSTGVSDSVNSYASSAVYNAAGQLTSLNHQLTSTSTLLQRQINYSPARLQPTSILAYAGSSLIQSLSLNYPTPPNNNGNISTIANNMDTTRSQSFSYDNLNRLSTAGDASHWSESYAYDNWGNMLAKSISLGSGYPFTSTSAPNNQNTTSLSYDSAGNVTADEFGNSFTYDANGRIITGGAGTYAYDGYGNRVEKTVGSTTTLYWPSSVIGVVDESNAGATSFGQQIFLAGLRVWSQDTSGNGRFLFTDHLGSTRVTANASGTVLDDIDYRGFGDIASNYGGSPTSNHYLYTGYESDDTENNTDFAQFRNHSAYMGRFSRPDPYDESYDPTNPQSLNRYSYVSNQPLNTIDPSGLLALNAAYYDINYDFFQLWGFGSWGPTFLQGAGGGGGGGGAGQNGPDKNGVYGHCDDPAKCKVTCVGGGVCFYQNDPPTKKDNCSTLAAYSVLMIPLGFPEGAGFFGLGGKIAGRVLGTIGAGLAIGGASCL